MYSSSFRLTNRDIDLAFEAAHLFIVCQPKIALATGEAIGAEAYVRWNHPDYGLLPPGLFLSFFERRERAGELTRYVASAAADTLAERQGAGRDWPLSINLGAPDLADMGLPGALDAIMAERGLDPATLILEVPEGAFARHGEAAAQTLAAFRRLGFRTALDGGGAVIVPDEFISPDYFDEVKIGGAAIIQFAHRLKLSGLGFVGKRVALAASRGLGAAAVGVEDETTLAALSALGFTAAQGAYICRPLPPEDLTFWSAPHLVSALEEAETEILLTDPLPEEEEPCIEEVPQPVIAAPVLEYSWEDVDPAIPGEEIAIAAWRLDRTCLSPDRHLLALVRRPRRLAHMAKPARKEPKPRAPEPAKMKSEKPLAPRAPKRKPRTPSGLVTRPSLVQIALGF
ncbi:diguanylate phosphodiesterase [Parvibaculum lavamentivorans DS-1]|uniref:Diguanylate phosphodiesterase n=1 Tax=Parvibaculum lavamentivorans (strain DS-1 / DSM 13023 / NCIMB 13966) TaxID=402881 RepID=A7HWM4_PARL1|nr:EAL domain-containing protein [Parvibaculum lavamentivorans]ABS64307.1 diguanylate phosphodiesterase [Parvibaculum lavamentivorans DS-1]